MQTKYDTILVLDFGGQYCHLIGRRIREHGVYSEIVPHDITPDEIKTLNKKFNVKGLILSGGPSSVYEPNAPRLDPRILEANLPILGLCYGHQLIAQITNGKVEPATCKEYGIAHVAIDKPVGVSPPFGTRKNPSTACSGIQKLSTRRMACACSATSSLKFASVRQTGRWKT
jgi:GMP synthase (glutamine-hydrolysing)